MRLRAMAIPLRTLAFHHGMQASEGLMKMRNRVWTCFASWLIWAMARWRQSKGVKIMREHPTSRWCDHVERDINNQIIYGHPHGESCQS
jgi:hypothetical protein